MIQTVNSTFDTCMCELFSNGWIIETIKQSTVFFFAFKTEACKDKSTNNMKFKT